LPDPPKKIEFILSKKSLPGTGNPIVSRTIIQTGRLLTASSLNPNIKEKINTRMMEVMERLAVCQQIANRIYEDTEKIINKTEQEGIKVEGVTAYLPAVKNLKDFENFLRNAKHVFKLAGLIIKEFFPDDPPNIKEANFKTVSKWANKKFGEKDEFAKFVASYNSHLIKVVVDYRNAVEHPEGDKGPLLSKNFSYREEGLEPPIWYLEHQNVGYIHKDLINLVERTLEFLEGIIIHCLTRACPNDPIIFHEISEKERDPECPIRFKADIHPRYLPNDLK
jgi:hypothetical protein